MLFKLSFIGSPFRRLRATLSADPTHALQQTPTRFFYGWVLLCVTWLLYGLGACPGYYSWPFFTPDIQKDLGLTRAQTGTVFGIFAFVITSVGPLAGTAIARWGIRNTMVAGHLLSALGFWLTYQATGFASCLIFFSFMVGAGIGIGSMVPCQAIATEWFQKYRGRAIAVVLSAGGVIGAAVTWFDRIVVEQYSYQQGWLLFVFLELALIAVTLIFIRNSPSDIGQFPDGMLPYLDNSDVRIAEKCKSPGWTFNSTIRTRQFVMLLICNVAISVPWSVTVGHGRLHLEDSGLTIPIATGVLSVMVFMSVPGRLCGGIGDLIKPEKVLACSLILEGAGIYSFLFASNTVVAYSSSIAIALGFGASYISLSVVIANFFGKDRFAKTVGLIYLGSGLFNAPAAGIAGKFYDYLNSYFIPFAAIGTFAVIVGLLTLRLQPPTPPETLSK